MFSRRPNFVAGAASGPQALAMSPVAMQKKKTRSIDGPDLVLSNIIYKEEGEGGGVKLLTSESMKSIYQKLKARRQPPDMIIARR